MRRILLLAATLLPGLCAWAQTVPCPPEQARAGRATLGLSLDSLRLAALAAEGPCGAAALGRYRRRPYLALADGQGRLMDTLRLPEDSTRYLLLPLPGGALSLRPGPLEEGLPLTRYTATDDGLRAQPIILSLRHPAWDMLPPPGPDITPAEAVRYSLLRYELLTAGVRLLDGDQELALLVRRNQRFCAPGQPGCCKGAAWAYYLVTLTVRNGALELATLNTPVPLPGGLHPTAPTPTCDPRFRTPAEEPEPWTTLQPLSYDARLGWLVNTGSHLLSYAGGSFKTHPLPPKTRAGQVWVQAAGTDRPYLLYRTGGLLTTADERQAFRRVERWVVSGLYQMPLSDAAQPRAKGRAIPLPADAETRVRPLGFFGGRWWFTEGYSHNITPAPKSFGR